MINRVLLTGLVAGFALACSSGSGSGGTGGNGGGGAGGAGATSGAGGGGGGGGTPAQNCSSRCNTLATQCGEDPAECAGVCSSVTEQQLTCLEQSNCDATAAQACLSGGTGGGGGSGGGGTGGGSSGDCLSRCQTLATTCGEDPTDCGQLCEVLTDAQLTCLEQSNCDPQTAEGCIGGGSAGGN